MLASGIEFVGERFNRFYADIGSTPWWKMTGNAPEAAASPPVTLIVGHDA